MSRTGLLLAIGVMALGLGPARAAYVIDIEPVTGTLAQGGTTQADVYIYSDTPGGEDLSTYEFAFLLTRTSGTGQVYFKDQATYGDLFSTNNYVFQDGGTNYSSYEGDPGAYVGEVSNPAIDYAQGTYDSAGGDGATDPFYVNVPYYDGITNTTKKLLTILTFKTPVIGNTLMPDVGSTFAISLVQGNPDFPTDFNDVNYVPQPFTSNTGTLTIQSGPSVPEPGSLALVAIGLIGLAGYRIRHRKA